MDANFTIIYLVVILLRLGIALPFVSNAPIMSVVHLGEVKSRTGSRWEECAGP